MARCCLPARSRRLPISDFSSNFSKKLHPVTIQFAKIHQGHQRPSLCRQYEMYLSMSTFVCFKPWYHSLLNIRTLYSSRQMSFDPSRIISGDIVRCTCLGCKRLPISFVCCQNCETVKCRPSGNLSCITTKPHNVYC